MDGLKRQGPEDARSPEGGVDLGGLTGSAFEHLPVPVALGLWRGGAAEPELLYGNGAFERLFAGRFPSVLPSYLGDLAAARSDLEQRRVSGRFGAGEAFTETLTLAVPGVGAVAAACQWTPLPLPADEGGYWSATLTVRAQTDHESETPRDSSDRLAAIFEYSPVDICLKDAQGRYVQVSKRFEEVYGVTNAEIKGKLPIDVGVDPGWAEKVTEADNIVLSTGKPLAYEETIPLRQGVVEGFTVKFPLIGAGGELQGIGTICTDITERKEAERALARSEREAAHSKALLSEAIKSMTDGFVWFDSEGRLVLCNQKYRDLYPKLAGALKAGAAYADLMKLAFERDQFAVLAGFDELNGIGDAAVAHVFGKHPTFRTKTSEGRWIEARNHPLETGGFIGIRFDVTEQVAAEDALKESEQRFKDFAQSGPGGFWEMDESLRLCSFLDVQTEAGRSRPMASEATGRTLWELFAADAEDEGYWRRLRERLERRRSIKDLRTVFVSKEGERFYWRINGKPFYDRTGRFRGYRGVAEDESAEVRARQRAEAAEERLIDAIESISGGFALFDADDRLVLCNQTYRNRAIGDGRHIYPGATFEEIARVNVDQGCVTGLAGEAEKEAWMQRRLRAHHAAEGDFEIAWHDGRVYQMTERRTHDGGVASVSTDITELKRAREIAEQANQAKTRFLAAASHDLRQPLHAIELFVAALAATADDDETHGIISDLREASNAAGRLLNAMQDVSELESGKLECRFMQFPVQQLLDRMVRVYGPQARERGLELKMVPSSQVVYSDPNLLERILGNLLSNAVRYTPAGRVLLGCRRRNDKLRIEVWDTGLGIPEGERQRIFEEFHQLDNPARERRRGIGLGLSIVRRLASTLGHEIFLHSVRGQGSVFAVQLDLTGKSVALSHRSGKRDRAGVKSNATVLVIDDDRQVRKGMVRALESWGCRVAAAGDYDAAADIVAAAPDAFDLIIADYRLPNACNGVRAAGRLRVLCKRMVPVLIVTADQGEEEMREITEEGFPTLQKPVDPEALALAVRNLLEDFAVSEAQVS
ncbi:PAS-domain containing protein [Pelagibius sp. CAU 1746]|uniref:PAS-domain containing protein n=1 Tax=Pelagibius sp. CAU 1746 TaxID=3140370 RepID=UPI00325A5489